MFADDVDEDKNDMNRKKKTGENRMRERDDTVCSSFFLPVSSKSCFCCVSSLFLFLRLMVCLMRKIQALGTILCVLLLMLLMLLLQRSIRAAFVQKQGRFLNCKTALSVLLSFPGFFPSKDPVVFARFDDAGERVSGLAAFAVASIEQLSVQRPVRVRL